MTWGPGGVVTWEAKIKGFGLLAFAKAIVTNGMSTSANNAG